MNLRKTAEKKKWQLSPRDVKIVDLLSKGKGSVEVGKLGGISNRTVESIIATLKFQYKCENIPHLVATFLRKGLIK